MTAAAPVIRRKYTNPEDTLRHMALKIREASRDPATVQVFQQFAEAIVQVGGYPKGKHITNERAAQLFLDYVRKNVRYRPDPPQTELVKSPAITLCVPGAPACIPIGDCDDGTCAVLSLCAAYGIDVQIGIQDFGVDKELHVLGGIKSNAGKWLAVDPSHESYPVGKKAPAPKEIWVDPFNMEQMKSLDIDGHESEFVAIGGLPSREMIVAERPRFVGQASAAGWTLVAPVANGSTPIIAGSRYKIVLVAPLTEPSAGVAIPLPPPLAPFYLTAGGGDWTSDDTTQALGDGWLVESVVANGSGSWTVVGVAKKDVSLQQGSAAAGGITFVQILEQTSPAGPGQPLAGSTSGMSTGAKAFLGFVVLGVAGGGVYLAVKHHQRYEVPRGHALRRHAAERERRARRGR